MELKKVRTVQLAFPSKLVDLLQMLEQRQRDLIAGFLHGKDEAEANWTLNQDMTGVSRIIEDEEQG